MTDERKQDGPNWQMWVAIFIALILLATVAYTFGETFVG